MLETGGSYLRFTKEGDILTMKLNINSNGAILSYKLNDKNEFIAYNNVIKEKDLNYRLIITVNVQKKCILPIDRIDL